jgi:hypothetical protein
LQAQQALVAQAGAQAVDQAGQGVLVAAFVRLVRQEGQGAAGLGLLAGQLQAEAVHRSAQHHLLQPLAQQG